MTSRDASACVALIAFQHVAPDSGGSVLSPINVILMVLWEPVCSGVGGGVGILPADRDAKAAEEAS